MTDDTATPKHKRGATATRLVLEAALEYASLNGLEALTIEGLAAHLHISKSTMYRRWPNASALMIDALLLDMERLAPIEPQPTVRQTFLIEMMNVVTLFKDGRADLIRFMIGRAQSEKALIEQITSRWVEPRRKIPREIIRQGIRRKELVAGINPDIVLDCLYGAICHRLLLPYGKASIDRAFVEGVVNTVFDGITVRDSSSQSGKPTKSRTADRPE